MQRVFVVIFAATFLVPPNTFVAARPDARVATAHPSNDSYITFCDISAPRGDKLTSMFSDVFSIDEDNETKAMVRAGQAFRNWLNRTAVPTVGTAMCYSSETVKIANAKKQEMMDDDKKDGGHPFDTHWKFVAGDEDDHKPR